MSKSGHHVRNSSSIGGFSAGDAKREINQILGKNARTKANDNDKRSSSIQTKQSLSKRKQKLETKKKNLRSKSGINTDKYNSSKKTNSSSNDKIVREQQKISTEWMKISKEKDLLDKEKVTLKKEKVKLSKERNEMQQEIKKLAEERRKIQALHKNWKQESNDLLKKIEEKYSSFNNMKSKGKGNKLMNEEYIEQRRISLENHVSNLDEVANELPSTELPSNDSNNLSVDMIRSDTKRKRSRSRSRSKSNAKKEESGDIAEERVKLQRQQQAAKESQKRAEKTLKELYRKKQELKKEQAQFENDRKKFKRMENEYNEFVKEKQRLKNEKKELRDKQKFLAASSTKKSKMELLKAAQLENEKENLEKSKNILQHKQGLLSAHQSRISTANISSLNVLEVKEFRDLKKKVIMYQDQIDSLENQNKILQRKLKKRDKFANDYAEDLSNNGTLNNGNTKYLISTLRSKVIELQNKNKLLTKLIKRHKNVNDAYGSIKDLKNAKKLITKLVIQNEELSKRCNVLQTKLQRQKDIAAKYQTKLFKVYDDDDDEDDDEEEQKEEERQKHTFNLETMEMEEINALYDSMKEKIAELTLKTEELEESLQDKETEILQYESYANEWDIKHRLGEDRDKALYGKLRLENEKLQNKIDVIYEKLEKEKAAALTWQNTIEDKLLQSENIEVGDDEKVLLINQLKEENKALKTELGFNDDENVKGHKAIAMDMNEQFGTGLFNNLQYILMDADLQNDDMLKLKIKDKNDQLYNVVLIKVKEDENTESKEDGDAEKNMDHLLKPIMFEQKNMVNNMENINSMINDYDDRISRIVSMLGHIKNSRKLLKWNAIDNEAKRNKPRFDLVVSELREINVDSPSSPSTINKHKVTFLSPTNSMTSEDRHKKTMRKFMKNRSTGNLRYRTESMESLDSVYNLSYEDSITQYGMSMQVTYFLKKTFSST